MPCIASPGRWPAFLAVAPLVASLALAAGNPTHSAAVTPVKIGAPVGSLGFRDVGGKPYALADLRQSKAVLFIFLSTHCPVSNSYTTRLQALQKEYGARGVTVFGVNSNRNEGLTEVAQYAKERGLGFPMVKDPDGALAKRLGATVTPEVVLLDASGVVRYRGRIDDQRDATRVKTRDLQAALEAVLSGQKVARAETKPFGCSIQTAPRAVAAHPKVTFTRDVAPIMQASCQGCHRPGEIGPFPLLTYEDASAWAGLIKDYVQRRAMPPWKPVDHYVEYQDARKLSDAQIRTIAEWVDEGAPKGDPKDMPPPRHFVEGWQLGQPDMVLDAGEPYELAADGRDVYRNFVLPYVPDKDRWLKAIEVRPDRRAVVHHVILYADPAGKSLALDQADPGPGYTSSGGGAGFFPALPLGGWAPGNTPRFTPDGTAIKLPKGSHLVLQVHYHKNGTPQQDRTRIGLHFAKEPVRQQIRGVWVLNLGLKIPADAARQKVTATAVVSGDMTALSVVPHMHLLGREIQVTAALPDGTTKPLVWVKDWDFNWQETYVFKEPIKLPKGTRIEVVAYYDNSTGNPNNPNNPPKEVTWGEQTTDEMCLAVVGGTMDGEDLIASGEGKKVAQAGK
jgi:peroxiredoxin/cytochrome c553